MLPTDSFTASDTSAQQLLHSWQPGVSLLSGSCFNSSDSQASSELLATAATLPTRAAMPRSRSSSDHSTDVLPQDKPPFSSHHRKMMQAASPLNTTETGSISIPTISTIPDTNNNTADEETPSNTSTASSEARVDATTTGEAAHLLVPALVATAGPPDQLVPALVATAGPPDQLAVISPQPAASAPPVASALPAQQAVNEPASVPISRETCSLPAEVGPCRASIPRWAHSPTAAGCISFIWGGCQGNANNFRSYEECRAACGPLMTAGSTSTNTSSNTSSSTAPAAGLGAVQSPAPAPGPAPELPPLPMPVAVLPDMVLVNGSTQLAAHYVAQQAAAGQTSSSALVTCCLWKLAALMLVAAIAL